MKIAVITGASSGLGLEFLSSIPQYYPDIEEYWLIARRRERLEEIASKSNVLCRILPLDLTDGESFSTIASLAAETKPDVRLLINNSGCGYLGAVGEGELEKQTRMTELNVVGLTATTHTLLPYIGKGGAIINISSIASFCPNPNMTVYSSTKAYVTAFSLGLGEELKQKKISVTAVCPGPMDTEFLTVGNILGNSKMFETLPYCNPAKVARGALRAAVHKRSVYTPMAFYKLYRFIAKVTPVKLMMKISKT